MRLYAIEGRRGINNASEGNSSKGPSDYFQENAPRKTKRIQEEKMETARKRRGNEKRLAHRKPTGNRKSERLHLS